MSSSGFRFSTPRRALVTGGASGLGLGIAKALLATGSYVAIGDVDRDALGRAAAELDSPNLLALPLDVTSAESAAAAVRDAAGRFGGLDALVNSAGVIDFCPLDQISEAGWDRVIDINVKGVFLCSKAAAPFLRTSGRGRIVSISSDAGKKGYPLISAYCASKFAVIGFSKAIAGELAPYQVTVNCVCPIGISTTGMGQQVLQWLERETSRSRSEILAAREQSVPLRRMARTEDVVNAVMFFLSEDSGFLTGVALDVDGGVLSTAAGIPGIEEEAG